MSPEAPPGERGQVLAPQRRVARAATWLRSAHLGFGVLALVIGVGSGLGAVGFRWLIFAFTWLATGREQFGQQGRVASYHLPFLGYWFLLLVPVLGGLLYGPLIQRFAREARGHGVPEVMIAVAEEGGRIRPQVTVVKALASALCIGVGGSVGREGPIVQIGSALASSIGQWVKVSEARLRPLVACGAAGAISATFNAPITGVFFGFELILRELSVQALFGVILASVVANVVSQAFFGSAPFFSSIPHDLVIAHNVDYLLVLALGALAGLVGVGFKVVLYRVEDLCDRLWRGRPEWARPAAGGLVLGGVLLALPEMYGVGYPVMDRVLSGHVVLWLVVILLAAKPLTASLTIGIGGSGGVFAPSLFTGAMAGMAFGLSVHHLFGAIVGPLALYGVVAMGAVFGAATQAPLTAIASVVEMSGNYRLTVAVMLGVAVAVGLSRRLTYGTIYTTKLLRRGVDVDRPRPANLLQVLTVADVMEPIVTGDEPITVEPTAADAPMGMGEYASVFGVEVAVHEPQALLESETLEQALRQLALFGPDGMPVLSDARNRVVGWVTHADVVEALSDRIASTERQTCQASEAARWATSPIVRHRPPEPIVGHDLAELVLAADSALVGRRLEEIAWPPGWTVAAARRVDTRATLAPADFLRAGDRLVVLAPAAATPDGAPARDDAGEAEALASGR